MLNVLNRIPPEELYAAVEVGRIRELERLLASRISDKAEDSYFTARLVLALYGREIMLNAKIRRLMLSTLGEKRLTLLANAHLKNRSRNAYTDALMLSKLPWKASSSFVFDLANEFRIPKEYLPLGYDRNPTVEIAEPVDPYYELFDYQRDLCEQITDALSSHCKRFLVQMPTGAGKTRTVIESLIQNEKVEGHFDNERSIIWLAHTEELCEQAIDTFVNLWQHTGNSSVSVVRCWGSYKPSAFDVLGSFVVSTFQKAYSLLKRKDKLWGQLEGNCAIVVVDEAHKAVAPTYAAVINALVLNSQLIGVTATPGRAVEDDRSNMELAAFFDKKLLAPGFKKNPIEALTEKGVLAKVKRKVIETGINFDNRRNEALSANGEDFSREAIISIGADKNRNLIILDVIREEVKQGNPCLVFSCSVEHSQLLAAALTYEGILADSIDCNMRKGARKRTIELFKAGEIDVLINYGILSTGFDSPRIRTVIISRPTTSIVLYSQMLGRGLRGQLIGGAESFNLIDIRDNFDAFGDMKDVYHYFDSFWG